MTAIKEILEVEHRRSDRASWKTIHVFRDAKFWRAYEVSAWLFRQNISEFQLTHRKVKKTGGSVLFVGFPTSTLEKRKPEGVEWVTITEDHLSLALPLTEAESQAPFDEQAEWKDFEAWKAGVPLTEGKGGDDDDDTTRAKAAKTDTDDSLELVIPPRVARKVVNMLLEFAVEKHTPLECQALVMKLREILGLLL